jgi:N-acetylneuraminate lyase
VVEAAAGRIPVMVHVGATTTADAEALARHAEEIGADAISSVAPIYFQYTADVVFEHYRRIGSASNLPLYVYHLSIVNTLNLDAKEYVDRLLEIPNIAGMKFTDKDLYQLGLLVAFAGDRLRIFSGADQLICHATVTGCCGAIGTFYNIWGPACKKARESFMAGDFELGQRFMRAFQLALAEIIQSSSFGSFMRSAMRLKYDIDIGDCRQPLGLAQHDWQDADVQRIIDLVDSAAQ